MHLLGSMGRTTNGLDSELIATYDPAITVNRLQWIAVSGERTDARQAIY